MKTTSILCVTLGLLLAIPALSQASVQVDVGSLVSFGNGPGTAAGRFVTTGVDSSGAAIDTFDTFCTETGVGQIIHYNVAYKVAALGITTSGRLGNEASTSRTLTPIVAWAYTQFMTQNVDEDYGLFGFDFDTVATTSSNSSANSLQKLVWGNLARPYGGYETAPGGSERELWEVNYLNAVDAFEDNDASNDSYGWDPDSLGDVWIMQMTNTDGTVTRQDQLVYLPQEGGGGNPVPEAASFATWSLLLFTAVMGLSYRRR